MGVNKSKIPYFFSLFDINFGYVFLSQPCIIIVSFVQ
jgi:hypothetical protein